MTMAPVGAGRAGRATMRDAVILAFLVIVGVVSCYLRIPAAHRDIVWGEDGEIFLLEYLERGFWGSVFHGYAGYQHLIPRLAAAGIVPTTPLDAYPVVVFAVCAVLTGAVGAAVYFLSRDIVPWVPARVALALITFVLPLATQEVIGNLADFHTYCMWLAPWLLFWRPRAWWSAWLWAAVAFLVVMTEVQSIVFVLLLPFVIRRDNLRIVPIAAAFVAGAIWQVATVLTVERNSTPEWLGFPSLFQGYLINTVMPMLIADPDAVRRHLQSSGLLIPLVLCVPFLIAFVVALVWGTPRQRVLAVALVVVSGAVYAGGAVVAGGDYFAYADAARPPWERAINIRYGVASGMLLAAVVPLAAAVVRARTRGSRRGSTTVPVLGQIVAWSAICGLVVVLAFASTRAISTRGWVTAQWSYSIGVAQDACAGADPADPQIIPIAPLREIELSCAQLLRGR